MRRLLITLQTKEEAPVRTELTPYAQSIVDYMKEDKVYTRRQVADDLGYLHSSVITKINELIDYRILKETDMLKCPYTKRRVKGIIRV